MARRLPPLNALRAFERAGRLSSLTVAADELGVTPGAVSRQIKLLEEYLGAQLFERRNREVVLTKIGRNYLSVLGEAFDNIDRETQILFGLADTRSLRVCCAPSLAMRWLVPHLAAFRAKHPEIDVHLTTTTQDHPDFTNGRYDIAIVSGMGPWYGMVVSKLLDGNLVPACTPEFLLTLPRGVTPPGLDPGILIHSLDRSETWGKWLQAVGASAVDASRGMKFETLSLAYQAALSGVGIMIAHAALIQEDIVAGRLIAPFDSALVDEPGWHVIHTRSALRKPSVTLFRDWLLTEARAGMSMDR